MTLNTASGNAELRPSGAFSSSSDYHDFSELVEISEEFTEVPVQTPYSTTGHYERWFMSKSSRRTWRLVEPDFPFRGLWEEVSMAA